MKLHGPVITVTVALLTALVAGSWIMGLWDAPPPAIPLLNLTYHLPPEPPRTPQTPLLATSSSTLETLHAAPLPPSAPPNPPQSDSALANAAEKQAAMAYLKDREEQDIAEAQTIHNNLRELAAAGQQYMLDKGVTQASYDDLVGTRTDAYIRSVTPAAGENYQDFNEVQGTTQISITTPDGRTIPYNL